MYIHNEAKLAYLANPRTASTATARALTEIGFVRDGTHHSARKLEGFTTFAAVRNHWDAAVSWVFGHHLGEYKDLVFTVETFTFALDNELVGKNKMWIHDPDFTMRYENLESDLYLVLTSAGLEAVLLPKENVSTVRGGRHYRGFYTDETRRYIQKRFEAEIERLGYEF